jgi:hypothetical protein
MTQAGGVARVETFRPRLAPVMALVWYGLAAFGAYDLFRRGDGREVAIGLACLALVTVVLYATAQRPALVAGPDGVLLRNVVRDVWVPWHAVRSIDARWSFSIATADRSYGSWAVTGPNASRWAVPDRLEQLRRLGLQGEPTGAVEVRPAWPVIAAFGVTLAAVVLLLAIPAG